MNAWEQLDRAPPDDARRMLSRSCASVAWVEGMLARRPFGSMDALLASARDVWWRLGPDAWKQAFAAHPRIGDRAALAARFPATHDLSAREQAGAAGAGEDVLTALATANDAYAARFGYTFIVCATGKTAAEMLALLHDRLGNDPDTEIRLAAEELAKITALRLQQLDDGR